MSFSVPDSPIPMAGRTGVSARPVAWAARIAMLAVLLGSCLPAALIAESADQPMRVCVSVLPQAFLVERVGGDRVEALPLAEAGQSPHSFEPAPARIAALSKCNVCFTLELPFEETVLRDLRAANPKLLVIDVGRGIERHKLGDAGEHEDGHEQSREHAHGQEASLDPHVWLSPANASVIARNIRDGLVSMDPEETDYYDANLALLLEELEELDLELEALLGPLSGASFYVFHPAFGYFAEAYGLRQVAIEVDGKEPAARDLAAVVSAAREEQVRAIFVQPQHPAGIAETVAREIGAKLVALDPLAYDYPESLRKIGNAIAQALRSDDDAVRRFGPEEVIAR